MKIEKDIRNEEGSKDRLIDRKEAIKKTGYIALSAATMMLLLSKPNKAVASSPSNPPVFPGGF